MPRPRKKTSKRYGAIWLVLCGGLGLALFFATHKSELGQSPSAPLMSFRKPLDSRESLYNNIYIYSDGTRYSMTFGYNRRIFTESVYNSQDDLDLPVAYTRSMTASLIYPKKVHSILEIGFGGGRTVWYLHKLLPEVSVTSVELDPVVVELSHKYFGIRDEPNFNVATEDGRTFLSHSKDKYDVILIDAYRGPFVPFHLLTKEFYQIVKDHLAEGGVVAQNIEPTTMLFDSAVVTINSVFPHIDFFRADENVVTIAYDGEKKSKEELTRLAAKRQAELSMRYNLSDMLAARHAYVPGEVTIDAKAKILSDDFAPVETLKAIDTHNRKWQEP